MHLALNELQVPVPFAKLPARLQSLCYDSCEDFSIGIRSASGTYYIR
jgi:hypothetical protein